MDTITYQADPKKVALERKKSLKIIAVVVVIAGVYALLGGVVVPIFLVMLALGGLLYLLLQHFSIIKNPYIEINETGITSSANQYQLIPWDDVQDIKIFTIKTYSYLVIDVKNNNDYSSLLNIIKKFFSPISTKYTHAIFSERLALYAEEPTIILNNCLKYLHGSSS